ncbi:SpoIIE family protein phosphatase [Herbaspirillum robiniae]|uniref:Protein-serine/threonine phosphatase n=1 Tax=Herbaspirillum robiniae TaxID=2014887 RepID=A0A246WMQ0_9BURK|nr:SpoIIE family protein phosphatase [Herbaspirillum robiniae]NUU02391.1 SpoIIE family protein phosphatase [Herbaspirillum robiniae]OWY27633.1 protein-serine/threonine phosphatase [Herbaspirillum robiniae]
MGNKLFQPTAGALAVNVPVVSFDENNARVLEIFGQHKELVSLPVVEGDRPIGLISRHIFMSQMSKPYHRELYERKSCIAFMDKDPLIVDTGTPIETLGAMAVASGDKTLADGFLIVEGERLRGLGSGLELMRELVALQVEKNRQVMQSIDYASVIQRAMLSASRSAMSQALDDACLVWEPRDVVGGDFYHFEHHPDGWFAAVADCTGHGVPGAFLTLIASSSLKQALELHGPRNPALVMNEVNRSMKRVLGQQGGSGKEAGAQSDLQSESDDGMDACFFWFDAGTRELTCANAKMSLFVLSGEGDEVQTIDGKRTGLGYVDTPDDMQWDNRSVQVAPGAIVFVSTDGIIDQIGGAKNIAFGKQRLRKSMLEHRHLPMAELGRQVMAGHRSYQGGQRRRDDVTFFGARLGGAANLQHGQQA